MTGDRRKPARRRTPGAADSSRASVNASVTISVRPSRDQQAPDATRVQAGGTVLAGADRGDRRAAWSARRRSRRRARSPRPGPPRSQIAAPASAASPAMASPARRQRRAQRPQPAAPSRRRETRMPRRASARRGRSTDGRRRERREPRRLLDDARRDGRPPARRAIIAATRVDRLGHHRRVDAALEAVRRLRRDARGAGRSGAPPPGGRTRSRGATSRVASVTSVASPAHHAGDRDRPARVGDDEVVALERRARRRRG